MPNDKGNLKKEIMITYSLIYVIILILFSCVLWQVVKISTFGGNKYRELGEITSNDSLVVQANRGNILDCNGKLLASTIPSYRLHMDMRADGLERDTFNKYIDDLCVCLADLYGTATPYQFKQRLRGAYNAGKRYFLVDGKRLSYTQYKRVLNFPLFRLGKKSGISWEINIHREHPFGKLGARTIGNNYANGMGYSGLEKAFNDQLKGMSGIAFVEKKGGEWVKINAIDPIDGYDITSALDIDLQDIAEEALEKRLVQSDAEWGCAVVMEVETGEIKAMANLARTSDSSYVESQNFALSAMTEPGSTFKTAAVMAALDDGLADTSEVFDTGCGYWKEDDWTMTDHNVKYSKDGGFSDEGGYHEISLAKAMWYSSNIGIAKMVDKYYRNNPRRFVNNLYEMRLKEPLDIIIPGAATPKLMDPSSPGFNRATLLWMSFGYNIQIPPIYTLTYYNGIANNGKMVSPVFVKSISENGTVIKTFNTKVVKSRLCSESTLKKVRSMLEGVVTDGTGKTFKSNTITFAGKTGTAQTNYWQKEQGKRKQHQYSFCGYFPADKPMYSCIVVVFQPNRNGISPAGLTFREIAEHVLARKMNVIEKRDEKANVKVPNSLKGDKQSLENVYKRLKIPYTVDGNEKLRWAKPHTNDDNDLVKVNPIQISTNSVPNVVGMGAKDAIYLMEHSGLKVRIAGYGDVIKQSIAPGSSVQKGTVVDLTLRHN